VVGLLLRNKKYLNQYAVKLTGKEVSFHVHFWGINQAHLDNPIHKHTFFETCYVIEGEGTYMDDDVNYPLRKGTLFLSRPQTWHQIRSQTGLFLLFVAFEIIESESTKAAIQRFRHLATSQMIWLADADNCSTALIWRALLEQVTQSLPPLQDVIANLSHALLSSVQQTFAEQWKPDKERPASSSSSALLYQAKLFIRDNLSRPLRLKDVANYLDLSERHLSRIFSSELGQTFINYIRKERIRHAATMLWNTNLPIKQIAQECGFATIHYFTHVFKAEAGTSPARFREKTTSIFNSDGSPSHYK
jgi:AraC-like DNA-binding protein/mannose-6-phosphate isomerase-like protein (cupin superfamily)